MKTRTFLLTLLLSAAVFAGCNRDDETIIVLPSTDTAFNFRVNGISDVSIFPGGEYGIYLNTELVSGEQQSVRLAITGVPSGVEMEINPVSGIPTFFSQVSFEAAQTATPGTYPLTLTATSETKGTKTFRFNLIIKEFPNCDSLFGGTWTITDACSPGNSYSVSISRNPTLPNAYIVSNFKAGGTINIPQLNANVVCEQGWFYVPTQQIGSLGIYGSGSLISGAINFNYSYYGSSGSASCTATFSR